MVRTNQGGSILEFIIIGTVMALLLVGGAYFVRQNLTSADQGEELVSLDNGEEESSNTPDESSDSTDDDKSQSESEETPATDQEDQTENESANGLDGSGQIPQTGQETEAPESLPETGPADVVLSGLLLGGLAAVAAVYLRSRGSSVTL